MDYKNLSGGNVTEKIKLYNGDCMELLRQTPDKYYDLAVVDPPYGIGECGAKNHSRSNATKATLYTAKNWDKEPPPINYFAQLFRVSKHQIIFGANHFLSRISTTALSLNSPCWIVWDKDNSGDFADCELAWTSFDTAVRKFTWRWNGMLQADMKNKEVRIHPTQKPIALYKWILHNYAQPTDKIIDTHLGSGSSAIAAHYFGCDFTGIEIDKEYFEAAKKRFELVTAQTKINF